MDRFLVILYETNRGEFHLAERERYFEGNSPTFIMRGVIDEQAARTLLSYGHVQDYTNGYL